MSKTSAIEMRRRTGGDQAEGQGEGGAYQSNLELMRMAPWDARSRERRDVAGMSRRCIARRRKVPTKLNTFEATERMMRDAAPPALLYRYCCEHDESSHEVVDVLCEH